MKEIVLKYPVERSTSYLRCFRSREMFDIADQYITIHSRNYVDNNFADYVYFTQFISDDVRLIYNEEICIVHIDQIPNTLSIFVSNVGLKNKNLGKGFVNELNIICGIYHIETISTAEVIILKDVPLKCYYPIIMAILRDDMHMSKPKKPRKKKIQKVKVYDVKYFPILYNSLHAYILKNIKIIDYRWAVENIGISADEKNRYVRSRYRLGLYKRIRTAIKDWDVNKFISVCNELCAYHYMLGVWRHPETSNQNLTLSPLSIENDMKSLYLVKAMVAKLSKLDGSVFTYLINETKLFDNVEYDYQSYDWYMDKMYEYSKKDKKIWGSYEVYEPRWARESSFTSPHSVMFPDEDIHMSFDRLMLDCYRRDIYDDTTYNDYYNYDYERMF